MGENKHFYSESYPLCNPLKNTLSICRYRFIQAQSCLLLMLMHVQHILVITLEVPLCLFGLFA